MIDFNKELKSEEWANKRKTILQRDGFTCCACGAFGKTLNVHHLSYEKGKEYWDYPDSNFVTLCKDCHKKVHGLKDGKLKKTIDELKRIAIERDCNPKKVELNIQVKKGDKYPLIYINGTLFKSYSYAYYLSRTRKLLRGKIMIPYKKEFCIRIFSKRAKIVSLKSELIGLINLGIVSNFSSFRFELNDIICGEKLLIYNEIITET